MPTGITLVLPVAIFLFLTTLAVCSTDSCDAAAGSGSTAVLPIVVGSASALTILLVGGSAMTA